MQGSESGSECPISTSISTIRRIPISPLDMPSMSSQPSSPRSSALPSPPDSPDSISSFPSLTSSFFFSSAAASPPHSHTHLEHGRDSTQGLIIPSLTLPAALRQPTAYGKTIGDVRLLVLGSEEAGDASLPSLLLEDNDDLVDVGTRETTDNGSVFRASTDWIEHRDAHGLERFEPANNVEIAELPAYSDGDDPTSKACSPLSTRHFTACMKSSTPTIPPSPILSNLIASPSVPFYTAVVLLNITSSPQERTIIDRLSAHIPIITLPPVASHSRQRLKLSAFRPASAYALRAGLFRSPETLALLRSETADRFLRWREVERAVNIVRRTKYNAPSPDHKPKGAVPVGEKRGGAGATWNKADWEAEWDATLSRDVARRLREGTITGAPPRPIHHSCAPIAVDPLHLPSLLVFSMSLWTPLKSRVTQVKLSGMRLGLVLVSTLCAGIGIGLMLH
ncbi:hypothetical protein EVG20_g5896 [Dentipellis fragilis]|uniref:Uncharacterized protein n=1 Tax=Dentipellis fragilis TaxID=205917 RepID=A0A4Y9YQD6_9AGAM|nr:hypothetical protein EVG20_g5896 [Dentipellis fragilis]